jgi:hypothetical protein
MKDFLSATSKNHIDESDIPTKTSVPLISDVLASREGIQATK